MKGPMDADATIRDAIELGQSLGLGGLSGIQQVVFAISEAEVHCDIDGIDSLLHRYGIPAMNTFAQAYKAIGATEIANLLNDIARATAPIPESLLALVNDMVTERRGYDYENVRAFVSRSA